MHKLKYKKICNGDDKTIFVDLLSRIKKICFLGVFFSKVQIG